MVHVAKTEARHAYRKEFEHSGAKCIWLYTKDGRPDLAKELAAVVGAEGVGADAEFYVCGPVHFMADVGAALESLGATRVHAEVFGTGSVPGLRQCPVAAKGGEARCPFAH